MFGHKRTYADSHSHPLLLTYWHLPQSLHTYAETWGLLSLSHLGLYPLLQETPV